jgi:hypothetical protein
MCMLELTPACRLQERWALQHTSVSLDEVG